MTEDTLLPPDQAQEPANYLEALIGPGGKFHREDREEALQELAKGKWKSDEFIRLKNMQYDSLYQTLNEKLEADKTRESLESLLARADQIPASNNTPPVNEDTRPIMQPEDYRKAAREEFALMRRQDQEQANFELVRSKLVEHFGDNYTPAVRKKITDLGLTPEKFNQWAREAPQAVLNALGTNQTERETFQSPPHSNRTFKPVNEQKRTWTYYQQMKQTNPKLYHDPKIMNQMLADAEALGAEFEDGDFHTRR